MPRKARPNRTDMLAQPIKAPQGGRYGALQELEQAQQAVPLPQQAGPGQMDMQSVLAQAQSFEMPVGLAMPTERPDEPLTAGMDMGAGPGSEVLESPGPDGLLVRGIAALAALGDDLDPATRRVLQEAQITLANRGRY